jgi:hypothetical protein
VVDLRHSAPSTSSRDDSGATDDDDDDDDDDGAEPAAEVKADGLPGASGGVSPVIGEMSARRVAA